MGTDEGKNEVIGGITKKTKGDKTGKKKKKKPVEEKLEAKGTKDTKETKDTEISIFSEKVMGGTQKTEIGYEDSSFVLKKGILMVDDGNLEKNEPKFELIEGSSSKGRNSIDKPIEKTDA
jgi:hypothetical protein